jgi:hypothetical protein
MSIGDVNSNARGSGARYNDGKVPLELIPLSSLEDCARVFGYGRRKYAAWNWAKGMQWSVPYGCLLRHMKAWFDGEDNDPESGYPHLGHAMCNLVMLSTFARTYREGDDRPVEWLGLTPAEALERVSMDQPTGCNAPIQPARQTTKQAYDEQTSRDVAWSVQRGDFSLPKWHVDFGKPKRDALPPNLAAAVSAPNCDGYAYLPDIGIGDVEPRHVLHAEALRQADEFERGDKETGV